MKRLLLVLALFLPSLALAVPDPDPARFDKEIVGFDAQDAKNPPEKGGIVFTGSSSIRLMDLKKVFPGLKALNRGFGGSHISDVNHYLDRCLLRYEPSLVVLYCGGNDLWDKKSPEQVEEDFAEFCRRLFEKSPQAKLIILAVRPSPARVSIRDKEADLNARFQKAAEADERITYVAGTCDRFLDKTGETISERFVADGLHMSDSGYVVWRELLLPLLPKH